MRGSKDLNSMFAKFSIVLSSAVERFIIFSSVSSFDDVLTVKGFALWNLFIQYILRSLSRVVDGIA